MKPERIQGALLELPGWRAEIPSQRLIHERHFADLGAAIRFLAKMIEDIGADPQITELWITGGRLHLSLADPVDGEVTPEVLALAARLSRLIARHPVPPPEDIGG